MSHENIEGLEPRVLYTANAAAFPDQTISANGFNVSVVSSTLPSLLVIGQKKIHGNVMVAIEGNAEYAQKGSFVISIEAELDGVYTSAAMVKRRLDVSVDSNPILKIPVGPIGNIKLAGLYVIYAEVNDPTGVTGISLSGPTLSAQLRTVAFSETLVSTKDISIFESDDYITGIIEAYTLQITNTGNVATAGNMQIKLEQDDLTTAAITYLSPVKIVRPISVPVGQSRLVTVKYKFTVDGVPSTGFVPVLAVSQDGVSDSVHGDFLLSG